MSDLTKPQRLALDTFLSEYDEPTCEEFSTFDLLIDDIRNGSPDHTCVAESFTQLEYDVLANLISSLALDISCL